MMTNRKFYKTVFTIEVLSEEPIPDTMDTSQVIFEATLGDFSMTEGERVETILNGKAAAEALKEQGSDPSFFRLNDAGVDQE